ncbi:hypothetical protein U8V72_18330 [Priestia filamentosa]|uniref:hypothetical protein n=1 Tax=Priestia filamentosa TaxID=1402861 RepID=UPI00397A1288
MLKKAYIILVSLLVIVLATNVYLVHKDKERILLKNEVSPEKAKLKVVTFGERIKDNEIYFVQWESLSSKERKEAEDKYSIFMFSAPEFQNKEYLTLINKLIQNKKTVLFYGDKMNAESILEFTKNPFPYYEIKSAQEIYCYMYGYSYSEKAKQMLPISVMGNIAKENIDNNLANYLIANYSNEKGKED